MPNIGSRESNSANAIANRTVSKVRLSSLCLVVGGRRLQMLVELLYRPFLHVRGRMQVNIHSSRKEGVSQSLLYFFK